MKPRHWQIGCANIWFRVGFICFLSWGNIHIVDLFLFPHSSNVPLNQKVNIIWENYVIILVTIVLKNLHDLEITCFTDFSENECRISYSNNLGFISRDSSLWKQIKTFDYIRKSIVPNGLILFQKTHSSGEDQELSKIKNSNAAVGYNGKKSLDLLRMNWQSRSHALFINFSSWNTESG